MQQVLRVVVFDSLLKLIYQFLLLLLFRGGITQSVPRTATISHLLCVPI
jgi:hypothetical protein